jgi:hypothetical protein
MGDQEEEMHTRRTCHRIFSSDNKEVPRLRRTAAWNRSEESAKMFTARMGAEAKEKEENILRCERKTLQLETWKETTNGDGGDECERALHVLCGCGQMDNKSKS